MLICKACKNTITNKYYKYLWINDHKTNLVICNECHMNFYIHKCYQFKKDHSEEYNEQYNSIYNK